MLVEDDSFIDPLDMVDWSCEQQEPMTHFPPTKKEFIHFKNVLTSEASFVKTVRDTNKDLPDKDYILFQGTSEHGADWECWLFIPATQRRKTTEKSIVLANLRKKMRRRQSILQNQTNM